MGAATAPLTRPLTAALTKALTGMAGDSGPVITAGPLWVNNQDGTATVTWTTDTATDSKVSYGTTSSYGSTVTDAAVVTSHSLTVTAADDVYHFSVSDIAGTYASADALGYISAVELSQFLILPHYIDVSDSFDVPYFSTHVNADNQAAGLITRLNRVSTPSGGYIRCINSFYENEIRPGVVLPNAPDRTGGTVTTEDTSNVRYNKILAANTNTGYIEWLIPSWVTGTLDKAVVYPLGGAVQYKLWRNRGGVVTEVLAATTPSSSVVNPQNVTLSDTLIAGDYLRWAQAGFGSGGGSTAYVASIQLYDSTGECDDPRQDFISVAPPINNSGNQISTTGSSVEAAYQIAPTGQAKKFVGGAAHQGGSFAEEYPHTETWTKNGVTWTPAGGNWKGSVNLTRVSTVYYDVTYPDIGTLTTTYDFTSYALFTSSGYVSSGAVDTGNLYPTMMPFRTAIGFTNVAATTDGQVANTESKSVTANTAFAAPSNTANAAVESGYPTPDGFSWCCWNAITNSNTMQKRVPESNNKTYNYLNPTSATNVTGITRSGRGAYFYDVTGGVISKPVLSATSCTVGSDGRTILVVPVTNTGGITGNTGLTFNVGGSPISLDSTTNNADGTITCVVDVADTIASADTVTVDVATASLYDAFGIMMVAASGIAVVNESAQA